MLQVWRDLGCDWGWKGVREEFVYPFIRKRRLHNSRVIPNFQSCDFNWYFAHFLTRTSHTAHPEWECRVTKDLNQTYGVMRSREIWRRSLFFSPGVLWSSVKVMEILPSLWKVCGCYVIPCPLFTLLLLICTMLPFSSTRILKMNLFSHAYSFWDIVWFYYSYKLSISSWKIQYVPKSFFNPTHFENFG